eukprot:COSAG06_NODE_13500_length_1251_cov_1.172743_1_plen_143_part_00
MFSQAATDLEDETVDISEVRRCVFLNENDDKVCQDRLWTNVKSKKTEKTATVLFYDATVLFYDMIQMVKGKVSLVAFGFRSSGDPMIKAFSMHWEDLFGMRTKRKRLFAVPFYTKNASFYQDRLRTNIRKALKTKRVLCRGG